MRVNQLKIGILLTYLGTGLNMLIQLLYTPVLIRILGQSEYGVYTLVGSVAGYLGVLSFGFNVSYIRFHSQAEREKDKHALPRLNGMFVVLFSAMAFIALLSGFALVSCSNIIFGGKLTASEYTIAKIMLAVLVINVAMALLSSIFEAMVSAYEQFVFQRVLNLAGVICNPLICLPLLLMGIGSVSIVVVTTLITFAKLCINIWFCVKKLKMSFEFRHFDLKKLCSIGCFSFFIFLNLLINEINMNVDKLILVNVQGSNSVAVYGVGAQINILFTNFASAVSSVFAPRVNKLVASGYSGKSSVISDLFIKVGRIQFLILGLISSGFVFFGKYFITDIYVGTQYLDSYMIGLLLILPSMIPLCQNMGLEIQRALNMHRFRAIVYFMMAIINVIISIFLSKQYGAIGAAAGTAISLIIANGFIMNIYYKKAIGLDIGRFWKTLFISLKGMIAPVSLGIGILCFVKYKGIVDFLAWIALYVVVYGISFWLFVLNVEEKGLIKKPLEFVRKRFTKHS